MIRASRNEYKLTEAEHRNAKYEPSKLLIKNELFVVSIKTFHLVNRLLVAQKKLYQAAVTHLDYSIIHSTFDR